MAFSNDNLDISLYFDLTNSRFRVQDNSDYAGATPAIDPADIAGVYALTDPNSNILHENADFNNPDIEPDSSLYSPYVTFTEADGVYTLVYSVYDSDTSTTYTKTFTFTYDADDIPDVVISVESDVGLATISSTDETPFTATKVLNTRTHTLTYPASWGSTTSTSIVTDAISLTELYTGAYVTTITSTVTITGTDDLIIDTTITGTDTHNVWDTDGYYVIKAALNTFFDRWTTDKTENPKRAREYAVTWNEINTNYTMYNSYKQNGDIENAGEYLNNIKELIPSDIDTTIDPSVSVPVTQVIPGYASQWLSGSGVPAASLGRTIDFYRDRDENIAYTKASGSWVEDGNLSGYTFSLIPGTILVPTDADGNNQDYTNATADIVVYQYNNDVTDDFTFTKSTLSNADGSVTDNTLTVSSITADTGYIDVIASQTGVASFTARIYVKKAKEGQAVVGPTSIDDVTIGLNGSSKLYVKDAGIDTDQLATGAVTGIKLDANIVDNSTLEIDTNVLQIKDSGVDTSQIANDAVDGSKLSNDITIANDLTVTRDLTVNGTTVTLHSETWEVADKNIEMGVVTTPSDATANGGGITLKGTTDKTIIWDSANDNWTANQNLNIPTGKVFKINNVSMLSATALGSSVLASSLTSVGTLTSLGVTGAITGSSTLSVTSTATASNFILSSDKRLKDDINVVNTNNIDGINIVCFYFKSDKTKRLRYGVIAQELIKTHPEMVYEDENGFLQVAYTDFLLVRLLSSENKIEALENRIRRLEKLIK